MVKAVEAMDGERLRARMRELERILIEDDGQGEFDPALADNLEEIVLMCYEAGASAVYVVRGTEAFSMRDAGGKSLADHMTQTVLVALYPKLAAGEPGAELIDPDAVDPVLGLPLVGELG